MINDYNNNNLLVELFCRITSPSFEWKLLQSVPESINQVLMVDRPGHLLAHHLEELIELDGVVGVVLADLPHHPQQLHL